MPETLRARMLFLPAVLAALLVGGGSSAGISAAGAAGAAGPNAGASPNVEPVAQPAVRVAVVAPVAPGPVVTPASLLTAVPPPPPPAANQVAASSDSKRPGEVRRATPERARRTAWSDVRRPGQTAPAPARGWTQPKPAPAPKPAPKPVPAPAPPPAPAPAPAPSSSYAAETVAGINAQRAANGLGRLATSACAQSAAQRWAQQLAATGQFAHQDLGAVLRQCGARAAAENLARTGDGSAAMVSLWMNSPSHRTNILNPRYTQVGSAAVRAADGRWTGVHVFLGF